MRARTLLAGATVLAAFTAAPAETVERARYLMGSPCRIVAHHAEPGRADALVEQAFDEIERWNGILSDWDAGSELSRLNAAAADAPVTCSGDLLRWLNGSLALARETSGAFDPTVGALVDLYALRSGGRWPSDAELASARTVTGHGLVTVDSAAPSVRFDARGMRLDPGGDGKGFALDAAADLLRAGGMSWALLDFGGQVLALGSGPGGRGFPVELPAGPAGGDPRVILLQNASVATTSNAERGLVVDGRALGHILDPRSARPIAVTGSLSVVAATARRADALSTALFVLGPDGMVEASTRFGVEALFTPAPGSPARASASPGFPSLLNDSKAGASPAAPAPSSNEPSGYR